MEESKVTVREKLCFGLGDVTGNGLYTLLSSYLLFFCTDVLKIGLAATTIIMFAGRAADAVLSPVMGILLDYLKLKNGKCLPLLRLFMIPCGIWLWLLFSPPAFLSEHLLVWYMAVVFIAYSIHFAVINIAYSTLISVLTRNVHERLVLNVFKNLGANLGGFLVTASTLRLVSLLGENQRIGFSRTVLVFAILFVFCGLCNARRMQIENLLLQINPHFIYNTLNSIVYMARMEGNRQIADFTGAFIALLQSTLNIRESVFSTVRDELRCVENYLNLQKYRYEDKFTYEIQCEEELLECQMLNVMLQPIVENAIFHGIAPMEGNGALKIRIIREEDALRISVEDNGVGMTRESIEEQFKKDYRQEGGVRKLGVSNVRERIREIYGEPYDMVIESQPGKGTWVIMRIPFRREKER